MPLNKSNLFMYFYQIKSNKFTKNAFPLKKYFNKNSIKHFNLYHPYFKLEEVKEYENSRQEERKRMF